MKTFIKITAFMALAVGCSQVYSPLNTDVVTTYKAKGAGSIDDFEDKTMFNDLGKYNRIWTDTIQPYASTMSYDSTVAGSTLPGGTPGAAIRLYGVMRSNINHPIGSYPYCLLEMDIALPNGQSLIPMAPLRRLTFHYKAGTASVGRQHRVTITHAPITTYDWFYHTFTPSSTNWTELRVKFPPPAVQPVFLQGGWSGVPVSWTYVEANATTVTFMPFSTPATDMPYDITIDDVRFE